MACGAHGALRGLSGRGVFHVERWVRDRRGQRVFRVVFRMRGSGFPAGRVPRECRGLGPSCAAPPGWCGDAVWLLAVGVPRGTRPRGLGAVGGSALEAEGPGFGVLPASRTGRWSQGASVPPGFLGPAQDPHPSPPRGRGGFPRLQPGVLDTLTPTLSRGERGVGRGRRARPGGMCPPARRGRMSGRRARSLIRSRTGSADDLMDQYGSRYMPPPQSPRALPGRRKDGPRGSNHLHLQPEGRRR